MPHHQKPPDPGEVMFLAAVIAPLMLGLNMALSDAPAEICVLSTWLTTHLLMILMAMGRRKP